jgi:addiction module RelE/StbE family toxin
MQNGATVRVRWLKKARKNLDTAMDYIAQDDPEAAEAIYKHIRSRVDDLAEQPGQGRPGRVYGTRELVIKKYPYLVPYRVKGEEVVILRVFHTSRKPPLKW